MKPNFALAIALVIFAPVASAALVVGHAVLSDGHMDFRAKTEIDLGADPRTVSWELFHQHDDEGRFAFNQALLHLRAPGEEGSTGGRVVRSAANGLDDPQYDFIGVAAGGTFYNFPQSQEPNLLWPGASTEDITVGSFSTYLEEDPRLNSEGEWVRFDLVGARGPGIVSLFNDGDGQATVWWTTSDGIGTNDSAFLNTGDHRHYVWSFSTPGLYELDVRVSALIDDGSGENVRYFSQTETIYIGIEAIPEPSGTTLFALVGCTLAFRRRRRSFL